MQNTLEQWKCVHFSDIANKLNTRKRENIQVLFFTERICIKAPFFCTETESYCIQKATRQLISTTTACNFNGMNFRLMNFHCEDKSMRFLVLRFKQQAVTVGTFNIKYAVFVQCISVILSFHTGNLQYFGWLITRSHSEKQHECSGGNNRTLV